MKIVFGKAGAPKSLSPEEAIEALRREMRAVEKNIAALRESAKTAFLQALTDIDPDDPHWVERAKAQYAVIKATLDFAEDLCRGRRPS